jgi:hypothetical protein
VTGTDLSAPAVALDEDGERYEPESTGSFQPMFTVSRR